MAENENIRRTVLFDEHKKLNARFTEFGGWEMPVSYSGLVDEHHTVRNAAGLFDVSHMGEIEVIGPQALPFLQWVTTNDVSKLTPGRAQYSLLTNAQGGVVDDIIVYQLGIEHYFICVNAANAEKDYRWLSEQNTFGAKLVDRSAEFAQIAIQGPKAEQILVMALKAEASLFNITNFRLFGIIEFEPDASLRISSCLIARTGYTGEDGFEIFCKQTDAPVLWQRLLQIGGPLGLKPCGLGARDTLRLEACLPLHGHELADDISALESGLAWVVKFQKGDFIGREILAGQKEAGIKRKIVGFETTGAGIVRQGAQIFSPEGDLIGIATSGTKTPTVDKALGLALIDSNYSKHGQDLLAEVRDRKIPLVVVPTPFYKRN